MGHQRWQDNPLIQSAKAFAESYRKDIVIIIHIEGKHLGYASYGKNKVLCRTAKRLADVAYKTLREYIAGVIGEPL